MATKNNLRNMTPAQFAALQNRSKIPRLEQRDGALPSSFAQQRLWFLDQLEPGNAFYNIPATIRLKGKVATDAMRPTWNEIVQRHEALRTRFEAVDGTTVQTITPELPVPFAVMDLSGLAPEEREGRALELEREEARTPFDLE